MAGKNRSPKRRIKNSTNPIRSIIKAGKWFLIGIGFFACLAIILSFTDIPYFAYYRLGTANTKLSDPPDMIVILSGSGMPSPDGLIRAYYGVEASRKFPDAKIINNMMVKNQKTIKK